MQWAKSSALVLLLGAFGGEKNENQDEDFSLVGSSLPEQPVLSFLRNDNRKRKTER
jgi:hypothetical protein